MRYGKFDVQIGVVGLVEGGNVAVDHRKRNLTVGNHSHKVLGDYRIGIDLLYYYAAAHLAVEVLQAAQILAVAFHIHFLADKVCHIGDRCLPLDFRLHQHLLGHNLGAAGKHQVAVVARDRHFVGYKIHFPGVEHLYGGGNRRCRAQIQHLALLPRQTVGERVVVAHGLAAVDEV